MNYQTELMQKILTNSKAQEIIDYVSQIYGDSYVGLWFFQAIGSVLEPVCDLAEQLMHETSPSTTTLLITYYENEYGIQGDPTMTIEQRRNVVIAAMRSKGACTPARLADAVSAALGGAPVEVLENTGKNQFTVNVRAVVPSYAPAIAVIERMKPAHLIYTIQGVSQNEASTDIEIGTATTLAELYKIRSSNSQTAIATPTMVEEDTLAIKLRDPIANTETIEDAPHTDDANGNVTLTTIKGSYSNGNVTLNRSIVTKEDE